MFSPLLADLFDDLLRRLLEKIVIRQPMLHGNWRVGWAQPENEPNKWLAFAEVSALMSAPLVTN